MDFTTFEIIYLYGELHIDPVFYSDLDPAICLVPRKALIIFGDYSINQDIFNDSCIVEVSLKYNLQQNTIKTLIFKSDFLLNIQFSQLNCIRFDEGFSSMCLKITSDSMRILYPKGLNIILPWEGVELMSVLSRWLLEYPPEVSVFYISLHVTLLLAYLIYQMS